MNAKDLARAMAKREVDDDCKNAKIAQEKVEVYIAEKWANSCGNERVFTRKECRELFGSEMRYVTRAFEKLGFAVIHHPGFTSGWLFWKKFHEAHIKVVIPGQIVIDAWENVCDETRS